MTAVAQQQRKLVNVGILTPAQLNALFDSFPKQALIVKHDLVSSVYAPDGHKVLSAARLASERWHVRAAEGLVQAEYPKHF